MTAKPHCHQLEQRDGKIRWDEPITMFAHFMAGHVSDQFLAMYGSMCGSTTSWQNWLAGKRLGQTGVSWQHYRLTYSTIKTSSGSAGHPAPAVKPYGPAGGSSGLAPTATQPCSDDEPAPPSMLAGCA